MPAIPEDTLQTLVERATAARERAYAPYSGFPVGAAVLGAGGQIWTGANVENASLGATLCAERVALAAAVAAGERQIQALAVVADTPQPVAPCGLCRQMLQEFAVPGCLIILANLQGDRQILTQAELLPWAFSWPGPR